MRRIKLTYLLLTLLLTGSSLFCNGQLRKWQNLTHFDDRTLHFGFYLGLNTMDYRLTNFKNVAQNPVFAQNPALLSEVLAKYGGKTSLNSEVYTILPGFTVGGVMNLRLNRDLDLRFTPGMSLGSRHFTYLDVTIDPKVLAASNISDVDAYLTTPSSYVDLPLGIRYKGFRHNNVRPYIYLGTSYRIDLENKRISENVIHLRKGGSYLETGLGLDSYLEYFRFTIECRFAYGLNNLIRHDTDQTSSYVPYYGYIYKAVNSNIFTLIFYFE